MKIVNKLDQDQINSTILKDYQKKGYSFFRNPTDKKIAIVSLSFIDKVGLFFQRIFCCRSHPKIKVGNDSYRKISFAKLEKRFTVEAQTEKEQGNEINSGNALLLPQEKMIEKGSTISRSLDKLGKKITKVTEISQELRKSLEHLAYVKSKEGQAEIMKDARRHKRLHDILDLARPKRNPILKDPDLEPTFRW